MAKENTHGAGGMSEGLFAMLIDLLPDYFYVSDADMRVVYVNKTAAEYFGLPKDQIVGRQFIDIEPDKEFASKFSELGRQIIKSGRPRVSDLGPYNEPDGTQSHLRRYDIPFRHPVSGEPMLAGIAQDVTDRVEREKQERQLAALHREMQIAREIQRKLVPKPLRLDWIQLAGASDPATYAGGDFFDWFRAPDGAVIVSIGDVSGHGVGPALIAAECRAYWRGVASRTPLPEAVSRLNVLLQDDMPDGNFVTFAAARLAPDGVLTSYSAGHGPLVIARRDGSSESLGSQAFPLGVSTELPTGMPLTRQLAAGDSLVLFSDGLNEARNRSGQQWTVQGLLNTIHDHAGAAGSELLRAIEQAAATFTHSAPQDDDRTVVVATFQRV